jgi:hypothetical protein
MGSGVRGGDLGVRGRGWWWVAAFEVFVRLVLDFLFITISLWLIVIKKSANIKPAKTSKAATHHQPRPLTPEPVPPPSANENQTLKPSLYDAKLHRDLPIAFATLSALSAALSAVSTSSP